MIGKKWIKWSAGATVAAALIALPAVGQARVHYTGRAPASVATVKLTPITHSGKKTAKPVAHKKLKLHAKRPAAKKLHALKPRHHALHKAKKA